MTTHFRQDNPTGAQPGAEAVSLGEPETPPIFYGS